MASRVQIARCADYDGPLVRAAVDRLFELHGGIDQVARPGDKVLLKPNILLAAPPEKAVCTHPAVLLAVIRAFQDQRCRVLVAEQPGIGPAREVERAIEVSQIAAVCREAEVEFRTFRENGYVPVPLPEGKQVKTVMLPRDFQEVDHVVSVAKLKSHMQATFSGAIKNFYGAIPTGQRKQIHALGRYVPFSEGIVDVFAAVHPRFGIIDGIVGMQGRGPTQGDPQGLGLLLASDDLVALDRVASSVVGWEPLHIHHIEDAAERGLGEGKLARIEIVGESFEEVRTYFVPPPTHMRNMPAFLADRLYNYWSLKPVMIRENCTACGACGAACPTGAISFDDGPKAVIDYAKCIECFCCHEMCAYDAIGERGNAVKRVLDRVKNLVRSGG